MTLDLATVLKAVEGWPVEDRRELCDRLTDGLPEANDPETKPELLAELDRRLADMQANPNAVVTWEQIMAHVTRSR